MIELNLEQISAVSGGVRERTANGGPHQLGDRHRGETAAGAFWRAILETYFNGGHFR